MNIFLTGPVGISGALRLYREHKELFETRFPAFFCRRIEQMERLSAVDGVWPAGGHPCEITLAKNEDCIYICTIADGGLFRALWEGCEKLKCGCEVFLERIPVRQEVVEITELTGDNPYEIESFGDLLIFSGKAPEEGWHQIGKTTEEKDRVVIKDGSRRFLTPPSRQQTDIHNRKQNR